MKIHILHCGYLKVKADKMIKPLSINSIKAVYEINSKGYMKISLNALLVDQGERVVLLDPGCADFLPSRLREEYGLEVAEPLEPLLSKWGYDVRDVTDVIFTHLHFDHGSGAFKRIPGKIVKRFPEAKYHVLKEHFDYAMKPHAGESNSFFKTFFKYLDRVHWLEDWEEAWIQFRIFQGHTRHMVVPVIYTPDETVYYVTDLLPLEIFMKPEVYSGYDLDSELAIREKVDFLNSLEASSRLILFHDPLVNSIFYP